MWVLFILFSVLFNFYQFDWNNKTCVALLNIWWTVSKNQIENWISVGLVMIIGNTCSWILNWKHRSSQLTVFEANTIVKLMGKLNLMAAYYFKAFMLDEWGIRLYSIIPSRCCNHTHHIANTQLACQDYVTRNFELLGSCDVLSLFCFVFIFDIFFPNLYFPLFSGVLTQVSNI